MKTILSLLILAVFAFAGCGPQKFGGAAGGEAPPADPRAEQMWTTDLPAAQARAKAADKLVFIDFTGSDWCPPCMALHDHVLVQKPFLDFAEKNLELVVIDFPKNKPLDQKVELANRALAEQYKVESFPTLIVLDAAGNMVHRDEGYGGKKAEAFTAELKQKLGR